MFNRDDFARMATQLGTMQGRFILSINDVPEIRTIFAAFKIDEVKTTYTIANRTEGSNDRAELLISRL